MGELQKWIRKSLDNLAHGGDEVIELVTPDGIKIRISGDLRANINLMDETGDMLQDTVRLGEKAGDGGEALKGVNGALEGSSKTRKLFKNQALLEEHYGKHGQEIADILGESNYSIDKNLDDANYIINNGTYVPELNGYVSFMSGKKYGFVGLDRTTGDITTFHIKNVSELIKKAPSLGIER